MYADSSYPDLNVSMERLGLTPEIRREGNIIGLDLRENEQGFIGSMNHEQALNLVNRLAGFAPALPYFKNFLKHVRDGANEKLVVYDGNGNKVSSSRLSKIYKDITERCGPYRTEWLDAKFSREGREMQVTYHKVNQDRTLQEVTEPCQDCLMPDKTPGISLDYWLENATTQGLPPSNTPHGDLHYLHSINGSVAWFGAYSVGVSLDCIRDPRYSGSWLGVRLVQFAE